MKPVLPRVIFALFLFALDLTIAPSSVSGALASDCASPASSVSAAPLENEALEHRSDTPFLPSGAYFVSPHGRDGWSGRTADPTPDGLDGPFATVERALSVRRNAGAKHDAIYLREGRYVLGHPVVLTAQDDGLTLAAYPGEHPTFVGARTVYPVERLPDGLYRVPLASDPGQEIFAGGRRMTLAFAASSESDQGWREAAIPVGPSSVLPLAGLQPADIAGATIEVFDKARSRNGFTRAVEIVQDGTAARLAPFYPEPMTDIGRYRLLGHPAWIARKGYFGWDQKGGMLVAMPFEPHALQASGIQVPVLRSLLVVRGAQDIRIDGLSFGETRMALARELESAAIVLENSRRVTVAGNDFRNIGEAVRLIGASDNIITGNMIAEAAASGIELQDGSDRNLILDNIIQGAGRIEKAAAAIYLHGASANRLARNQISDTAGHGIGIDNWDDQTINLGNIVERNHLRSTSRETFDTGAIEMLGRSARDTASIIRDNDISDAGPEPGSAGNLIPASAIYLDDLTSGVLVCGNHIRGAPLAAIQVHGGSDITVKSNVAMLDRPHAAFLFLEAADPRSGGERFSFAWSASSHSAAPARHRIEIRFDNDATIGDEDRDLFISRVEIAGRNYAPDAGEAVYSLTDGRVLPGQVSLPWNGALIWDLPIDAEQGQAVPVEVFAWGNSAAGIGAHFTVSVDGVPIGNAYAGRVDEMRGNKIAGNTVYAAAPDVKLLRSHSGGRPLLIDNAYVEPGGARGTESGAASAPARRTGRPTARRD